MQKSMPIWEVECHGVFMGTIAAVSLKQAKVRARAKWPHKRLQISAPLNVPLSDRDRVESNRGLQAKAVVR